MSFKTRNHRSANSTEFINGCPGDWLRETILVPDDYKISEKETIEGFVILTEEEVVQIKEDNKVAFESWQATQENQRKQALTTLRQEAITLRNELVNIKNNSTNANVAKLAEALLFIIKNTDLNLVE